MEASPCARGFSEIQPESFTRKIGASRPCARYAFQKATYHRPGGGFLNLKLPFSKGWAGAQRSRTSNEAIHTRLSGVEFNCRFAPAKCRAYVDIRFREARFRLRRLQIQQCFERTANEKRIELPLLPPLSIERLNGCLAHFELGLRLTGDEGAVVRFI